MAVHNATKQEDSARLKGFFRSVFCSEQISNINNGKAECGLIFSPVDTFENSNLLQMVE